MRFKDFPLTIDLPDGVHGPVMLAAFDAVTQVWELVDGKPTVIASGPAVASRARVERSTRMSNGKRARWAAELVDGTSWLVGHSPECCGCHRHALCSFVPPEPVVEEANA